MWELHSCENSSFQQNSSGRANITLSFWYRNVINMQPLVSMSLTRPVMEGLILGDNAPPSITDFLNATATFPHTSFNVCLPMRKLMWWKGSWLLPWPLAGARVYSRGAGRVSTVPTFPSNLHSTPRTVEDLPNVSLWELLYRLTFQGFHSRTHELQVGHFFYTF